MMKWIKRGGYGIAAFVACGLVSLAMQAAGILPTREETTQTAEAGRVAVAATDTALPATNLLRVETETIIPTETDTPSATVRPSETAIPTETDTPSATATRELRRTEAAVATSYNILEDAYKDVDGVTEVMLSTATERDRRWVVYLEVIVAPGANTETTADAIRQATYARLGSGFVEISMILDDYAEAVDYTWDNETDAWRITRLGVTRPSPTPGGSACNHRGGTCGAMIDCAEARACLAAGDTHLDRDGDGIPCESLCG